MNSLKKYGEYFYDHLADLYRAKLGLEKHRAIKLFSVFANHVSTTCDTTASILAKVPDIMSEETKQYMEDFKSLPMIAIAATSTRAIVWLWQMKAAKSILANSLS